MKYLDLIYNQIQSLKKHQASREYINPPLINNIKEISINSLGLTIFSSLKDISENFYTTKYLQDHDLEITTQFGFFKTDIIKDYREVDNILCFIEDLEDYFTAKELSNINDDFFKNLKKLLIKNKLPCYTHSSKLRVSSDKLKNIVLPFPIAKFKILECFNDSMVKNVEQKTYLQKPKFTCKDMEILLPIDQEHKELIYYFYCLREDFSINIKDLLKIQKTDLTVDNINNALMISAAINNVKSQKISL